MTRVVYPTMMKSSVLTLLDGYSLKTVGEFDGSWFVESTTLPSGNVRIWASSLRSSRVTFPPLSGMLRHGQSSRKALFRTCI